MSTLLAQEIKTVAIVGNPNSGKTTVFNLLTGMHQKVGNYPGVTVERKEGRLVLPGGSSLTITDLPGTYSLYPTSPDETIAANSILGEADLGPAPDLIVCVIDASNLSRNLYLATEILDRALPMIIVLNMADVALRRGNRIDAGKLSALLGVPVIETTATVGTGIEELRQAIADYAATGGAITDWALPDPVRRELSELIDLLKAHQGLSQGHAFHSAIQLLSTDNGSVPFGMRLSPLIADHVRQDRQKLDFLEVDRHSVFVETRYKWIRDICTAVTNETGKGHRSFSERIDRIVLHRFWGYLIFLALMGIMFQSVFSWALIPMELISYGFDETGRLLTTVLPPGDIRDLLVDGALAGVSAVVVFLPQILFLFFFLGLLEDTGYMARAAFLMDKLMGSVGLHGKSFIPLLSSFACAIPGIMATRTLDNEKDRLATMLVAPLMGCSARLPVYTLLIAAFVPSLYLFGFVSLPALVLLSLYLLGLGAALLIAWIFRKTFLKGRSSTFIMELPPYRKPSLRSIMVQMWERSRIFLQSAGTFILGVSIVLWFLATYPRIDNVTPAQQLEMSYAGQAGRIIEPLIRPLGFDWKIGIGLIGSLLQREVFVSTMGTIYNIQNADGDAGSVSLGTHLRNDRDPATGNPSFTLLTAICLMVYYVFAMQCMSTVAIMRRETNGWKWPLVQVGYMTVLAYGTTFIVYRIGMSLGWGI